MSEQVLTQLEVDRLVEGVHSGAIASERGSLAAVSRVRPLNLQQPSSLVRRRLPVLDRVFDRFAPTAQISLTKSLRFPVRAELDRIELRKFGEFRQELEGRSGVFQIFRLDPLRGFAILSIDPTLVYGLIDALMGGLGVAETPQDREISDIEIEMLSRVHSDLMRDLEAAWRPWFPLRVEPVRADRQSQIVTFSDDELCHIVRILIAGDVLPESPIHVVIPNSTAEPLHDAISGRASADTDPDWRANLEANVRAVVSEVGGILGETTLPTSRVQQLAVGDLIELPVRVDEEVMVEVERLPLFTGRLGQSHLKYGIRVTERLDVEQRTVDRRSGTLLVRKGLLSPEQLAVARVDERLNRRSIIDSVAGRGWVERSVIETALAGA